jgi:hypothetical protein
MTTDIDDSTTQFKRVMDYATERGLADGTEEEIMAALFDVFNGLTEENDDGSAAEPETR